MKLLDPSDVRNDGRLATSALARYGDRGLYVRISPSSLEALTAVCTGRRRPLWRRIWGR